MAYKDGFFSEKTQQNIVGGFFSVLFYTDKMVFQKELKRGNSQLNT